MDEFRKRLEDSLSKARSRAESEALRADAPAMPSDVFEERLRRAVETSGQRAGTGESEFAVDSGARSPVNLDGLPADLQTVVENWPRLQSSVRAFIVKMAQSNRAPQAA